MRVGGQVQTMVDMQNMILPFHLLFTTAISHNIRVVGVFFFFGWFFVYRGFAYGLGPRSFILQ